jgi:dihydroxy-acid dehydratase
MSGTSFGTVVLHVSPESNIGGPLAVVETGDQVTLSVAGRSLQLHVTEEEIRRRASLRKPAAPHYTRGYGKLFLDHVTQAHLGCDFDFLQSE